MYAKTLLILAGGLALSACAMDPRAYESTPVVVNTAAGPVTCQLYTHEQVIWDRAIARPESMDVETADNICRAEGKRELPGASKAAKAAKPAAESAVEPAL